MLSVTREPFPHPLGSRSEAYLGSLHKPHQNRECLQTSDPPCTPSFRESACSLGEKFSEYFADKIDRSEYKVLMNKTVLCLPLGGKQSPKTASISSFPRRRTPHHPLNDGVCFPLLCIWAGFVTSFARNSVSTHVQFWSKFEKTAFYSHFIQLEILAP